MGADFSSERRQVSLQSERVDVPKVERAFAMPTDVYLEFRTSLEGASLVLKGQTLDFDPVETPENRVKVLFKSDMREGDSGTTMDLMIFAADLRKSGTLFHIDQSDLILVHRPSDTRVFGKWDPQFHFLKFPDLHLGQEYFFVFNTVTDGVFAEARAPRPSLPAAES